MNKALVLALVCLCLCMVGCGQSSETIIKISDSQYGVASATSRAVGQGRGSMNLMADLSNMSAVLPAYTTNASAVAAIGVGMFYRNASGVVYITME